MRWHHNLYRGDMEHKADEISRDQITATLSAEPKSLALVTKQEGRFLSKWLEGGEGQLNMVTDWTWKIKRIQKSF